MATEKTKSKQKFTAEKPIKLSRVPTIKEKQLLELISLREQILENAGKHKIGDILSEYILKSVEYRISSMQILNEIMLRNTK